MLDQINIRARGLQRRLLALALGAGLLAAAAPGMAHHAFAAEFDASKPLELSGVVTKAKWVNPHSWLYFDVTGPDGKVTNWGVEFGAPNALAGKGLTKADFQVGQQVKVKGFHSKSGQDFGYCVFVTLPDGRTIQVGGAQDAPVLPNAQAAL